MTGLVPVIHVVERHSASAMGALPIAGSPPTTWTLPPVDRATTWMTGTSQAMTQMAVAFRTVGGRVSRGLPGMREFHDGAEWDVLEVRYVRGDDGV